MNELPGKWVEEAGIVDRHRRDLLGAQACRWHIRARALQNLRIEMTVARIGEETVRLHAAILAGALREHGFVDQSHLTWENEPAPNVGMGILP